MVAVILKELKDVKHLAQYLFRWVLNNINFWLLFLALDSAQIRVQIPAVLLTSYMPFGQSFHL